MRTPHPGAPSKLPTGEIGLGIIYFLVGVAAIGFIRTGGGFALIWPTDAIAAALLIRKREVRWVYAVLSLFLASVAMELVGMRFSLVYSVVLTFINLAEIGATVVTYRWLVPFPYPNLTINQASHMTVFFGLAIPAATAMIGGIVVHAATNAPIAQVTTHWWATDALGACLFGPPIILGSATGLRRLIQRGFLWQNLLTALLCLSACYGAIRYVDFPFVVFSLPLMVAAFRVGGFGASLLSLGCAMTVIGLWACGIRPSGLVAAQNIVSETGPPIIALLASVMPPIAVGLGTDARRKALRSLQFSERRFRESMDHSPIGMLMMDLEGVWTYTNVALQRMLGYSADEMRAFPPGGPSDPGDLPDIDGRWQKLKSNEIESYDVERRFMHKNGSGVWVHAAVSLIRNDDGLPKHFLAQIESRDARRRAEENLAEERQRLMITLRTIDDAVITANTETRITYINPAAERMLGQELASIQNLCLSEVVSFTDPQTSNAAANLIGQCLVHGRVFRRPGACVLHRTDGGLGYVTDVVSPVLDSAGNVTGIVVVLRDASAEVERDNELAFRATHDVLTGLSNRFEFQRRLKETFRRSSHLDLSAAVIAIDLDRFKTVNDAGGHAAGDAVLRRVAQILETTVRRTDTIARLGGDEFALILPNCSASRSGAVAEQILRALNPLNVVYEGATFTIGASVGLAMKSHAFIDEADWLAAADRASYQAKHDGRGVLRFADTPMTKSA